LAAGIALANFAGREIKLLQALDIPIDPVQGAYAIRSSLVKFRIASTETAKFSFDSGMTSVVNRNKREFKPLLLAPSLMAAKSFTALKYYLPLNMDLPFLGIIGSWG